MHPWARIGSWIAIGVALVAPVVALPLGGLDTAANVAQLVSVPLAVLAAPVLAARRDTTANGVPVVRWGDVLWGALPIVILAGGVLWASVVFLDGRPSEATPDQPTAGSTTAPVPTPTGPSYRTEQTVWSENFDSDELSPEKWRPLPNPDVVQPRDGHLDVAVDIPESGNAINGERIEPILPGWPIEEVSASVTAKQEGGNLSGGVVLFVRQASGRVTGLAFGPSKSGAGGEPWVCRDADGCGDSYGNFDHTGGFSYASGEPMLVTIRKGETNVEIRAGGQVIKTPADASPIIDTWFRLDAAPTDRWAVTIDDVRVTRES